MAKRNKLTREEHKRYGTVIKMFSAVITRLDVVLSNTYRLNHPVAIAIKNTYRAIGQLKCALDNEVCSDFFDWDENTKCYYGDSVHDGTDIISKLSKIGKFDEDPLPKDLTVLLDRINGGNPLSDVEIIAIYEQQQTIEALIKEMRLTPKTFDLLAKNALAEFKNQLRKKLQS